MTARIRNERTPFCAVADRFALLRLEGLQHDLLAMLAIVGDIDDAHVAAAGLLDLVLARQHRELRLALESAAKARNVTAGISGTDKTILATPAVRRPRAGWMRPAIIALALMLLIGQHLAPARSGNHREIASTVERRPAIPGAPSPSKRKDPGPKRARPAPKKHTARP